MEKGLQEELLGGGRVALYARVSGRGDQLSSLRAQAAELSAAVESASTVIVKDIGSGLNERRQGLQRLIRLAKAGSIEQVWVTHEDRLTRFGFQTLSELFAAYGVTVHVLHQTAGDGETELIKDFTSLLTSFSGRLYGQRSAAARARLCARVNTQDQED